MRNKIILLLFLLLLISCNKPPKGKYSAVFIYTESFMDHTQILDTFENNIELFKTTKDSLFFKSSDEQTCGDCNSSGLYKNKKEISGSFRTKLNHDDFLFTVYPLQLNGEYMKENGDYIINGTFSTITFFKADSFSHISGSFEFQRTGK